MLINENFINNMRRVFLCSLFCGGIFFSKSGEFVVNYF